MPALEGAFETQLAEEPNSGQKGQSIIDFHDKYFWRRPQQNFTFVDIGLKDQQGRLMALGFLNNDERPQNIDLVTVSDSMDSFKAHTFNKVK